MRHQLGPQLDILFTRPNRNVRGGKVALVESANLILGEGSDDAVQNTAVVEEHEIFLAPIMWVYKLHGMNVSDLFA